VSQHATLSLERWREFGVSEQVLMIANEMHRASRLLGPEDGDSRRNAYERVLRLTDLTIQAQERWGLRRELLRWRDLVAEMYVAGEPRPASHLAALKALLLLDRVAARQRPYVLPRAAAAVSSSGSGA
jgi:hypothetical protein